MRIAKKIFGLKFGKRFLMVLLLLMFVAALIPVFRLAYYAIPYFDDYGYGKYVKSFYEEYGVPGIIKGAVYTVKDSWHYWQGTYSSIFAMSINPIFLGEQYYFVGVWAVIISITVGSFTFSYVCARNVLQGDVYTAISFSVVMTLLLEEFVYTSYQGIFWYNSAVHYTFMHGMLFLMLAVGVKIYYCHNSVTRIVATISLTVLAVIVAGANFVTSLQGILFLTVLFVLGISYKRKDAFLLLPSMICYSIGIYFNYGAPGNANRARFFAGQGPLEAILNSLKQAFLDIPLYTRIPSIIVIAVLIPIIWNLVGKMDYGFKFPGIVTVLCFCLYATGYTASFYGGGGRPIERTMCAIQYTYQILLVTTIVYWLGWVQKKYCKNDRKLNYYLIYYFALAIGMCLCLTFTHDDVGGYLSYGSYYYTHVNWAQLCRKEYLMRIDMITDSEEEDVGVPPIIYRTWLLIGPSELSEDPGAEQNKAMAEYYKKNSIYLVKSDNNND